MGSLSVTDGAEINTSAFKGSSGKAGKIDIASRGFVSLAGSGKDGNGLIFTSKIDSDSEDATDSGGISISAVSLVANNGGEINSSSYGSGKAGDVRITITGGVSLSGFTLNADGSASPTGFFSRALNSGDAGKIALSVGSLSLTDGAEISTDAFKDSAGKAGEIDIISKGLVSLAGIGKDGNGLVFNSEISSDSNNAHVSGDINLNVGSLTVKDGAQISTSSNWTGNGGDISIKAADSVLLSGRGNSDVASTGIFSYANNIGNAGNISLDVGSLTVRNGAMITSDSNGSGKGGDITIKAASSVLLSGMDSSNYSGISCDANDIGNAGNISLNVGSLLVTGGAQISSSSNSTAKGKGGSIDIKAGDIILSGYSKEDDPSASGIYADTSSAGDAGTISIETTSLAMKAGALISTSTWSGGNGQSITINAGDVVLSGGSGPEVQGTAWDTAIFADANGSGNAGTIFLNVGSLTLRNGAAISSSSYSTGKGGDITIKASASVLFSGMNSSNYSGISCDANDIGNAGNISLNVGSLAVTDGAQISSSSNSGAKGKGGSIDIKAGDIILSGYSKEDDPSASGIYADTSSRGDAGTISIETTSLAMRAGAGISTSSWSGGNAQSITINAGDVVLSGTGPEVKGTAWDTAIFADANDRGNAGNIFLNVGSLTLKAGAEISSSSNGDGVTGGNGGHISVIAKDLVSMSGGLMDSGGTLWQSGIFTDTYSRGDAGNILVSTRSLKVADGAQIEASSFGSGKGGSIDIMALDSVSLLGSSTYADGQSKIRSIANSSGPAGDIFLNTGSLIVGDGAYISAGSMDGGRGGNIAITAASSVDLFGFATLDNGQRTFSGLFTLARGRGSAGNITIDTSSLSVTDAANINVSTYAAGTGGIINITARDYVSVMGASVDPNGSTYYSGIASIAMGIGNAGDIIIDTGALAVGYGALVSVGSYGKGLGGRLAVTAGGDIDIFGGGDLSSASDGSGDGGSISVTARRVFLDNLGYISAQSQYGGNAGSISISARNLFSSNRGLVTTSALMSGGGNIELSAGDVRLNNKADIKTDVKSGPGNGGNVTIDSNTFLVALGDSHITANADKGYGGDITIDAFAVFLAGQGVLDASSTIAGKEGRIAIRTPVTDIGNFLVNVPVYFIDADTFLPKRCSDRFMEQTSSFVVSERDGLPPMPDELLQ